MQVPPIPVPAAPVAMPQEAAVKAIVPQVQAQAAVPLTQRAVDPSPKSEKGHQTRSNAEKGNTRETGKRGSSVNIRV